MRAVIYEAYGAPPRLAEVPDPDCPADGVVVEVLASGVCRSDWHAWSGHDPVPLPMVPGHELAGRIVEVGPEVRCWRIGARVTVPFACGCGRCAHCASGDTHVCPDPVSYTHLDVYKRQGDPMSEQTAQTPVNVADIEEALRDVVDPELGINVVDLGLIYGVHIDSGLNAVIDMTLTLSLIHI